jgi:16S rRNA (cytosine1402-N4)-methyltransferase
MPPDLNSPADKKAAPGSNSGPYGHVSVLLPEVLAALSPSAGKIYVDATLGAGGHAEAILRQLQPDGVLYGIDQDPLALEIAGERLRPLGEQFRPITANFSQLSEKLPNAAKPITGGVLADLGVSSMQLDRGERGFSFSKEAPLDMRMSPDGEITAADVVNTYAESELVRIFSEYGEEHLSKTVAREIITHRQRQPFETTMQLSQLISNLYGSRGKVSKIHPATRVFQALRIEVNDELGHLQRFLDSLPELLAPGARIAIISFHSLEDRIVKQFLQRQTKECVCPPRLPICQCNHRASLKLLSGKPMTASDEEIRRNPRSRSAKLRAAIRLYKKKRPESKRLSQSHEVELCKHFFTRGFRTSSRK